MAVQIKIPGADFSASTLPKFKRQTPSGFDLDNLHALWLFENGAADAAISTALDSSGNGNTGTLANGSEVPTKKTAGVYGVNPFMFSMPNRGFMDTPFSLAMVYRLAFDRTADTTSYPMTWRPGNSLSGGTLATAGAGGLTFLGVTNEAQSIAASPSAPKHRRALFGQNPNPNTGSGSGSQVTGTSTIASVALYTDFVAVGLAYNPATNVFKFSVEEGVKTPVMDPTFLASLEAMTTTHLFGSSRWSVGGTPENPPKATLALVAMYNTFMSDADLAVLRGKASARVAARGVTVY